MSSYALGRELKQTSKMYKQLFKYNSLQVSLLKLMCPYQIQDRVELRKDIPFFSKNLASGKKVGEGSLGTVIRVDFSREHGYIIQVVFDVLPSRQLWMPARLFRSGGWDTIENSLVRENDLIKMVITEEDSEKFDCVISDKKKEVLATFSSGTSLSCRELADAFYESLRWDSIRLPEKVVKEDDEEDEG